MGYAHVQFVMLIGHLCGAEEGGHDDQYAGNHNLLRLVEHSSVSVTGGAVDGAGYRVQHEMPTYCNFLFHRRWRWSDIRDEIKHEGIGHSVSSS